MTNGRIKRIHLLAAVGALLIAAAELLPWRFILVSGESMAPTYHTGNLLIGRRQAFSGGIPFRRGEVVLFRHDGETLLKRIYALPGDEVVIFRLDEGFNLLVQTENYLKYYHLTEELGHARIDRFDVPPGNLFLLGDAPEVSLDSRSFGPIPQSAVLARIIPPPEPEENEIPPSLPRHGEQEGVK